MDYKTKQHLFHMLAGTFLGGKTFSEYCFFLKDALEEAAKTDKPAKGFKTMLAYTIENHNRAEKHLKLIEDFLKREPSTYELALEEVNKIEEVIAVMLQLSPDGQRRVKGLIEKLKNEQQELDYWKQVELEYKEATA